MTYEVAAAGAARSRRPSSCWRKRRGEPGPMGFSSELAPCAERFFAANRPYFSSNVALLGRREDQWPASAPAAGSGASAVLDTRGARATSGKTGSGLGGRTAERSEESPSVP